MNESAFGVTPIIGFLARWLTFGGVLATVGAIVFRFVVVRRSGLPRATTDALARRAASIGAVAALLVVPGALARLYFQTDEMRFPDESYIGVATKLVAHSTWGTLWMLQVAAALGAALVFRRAARGDGDRGWRAAGFAAGVLVVTPSLSSHAMSGHASRAMTLPADILHVLGASVWIGTLAVFFGAIAWHGRSSHANSDVAAASLDGQAVLALLARFSPLALSGAATVVASGVVSSFAHLGSMFDLETTLYGRLLLAKVFIVLAVAAFGWRNWKLVTPRVAETGPGMLRRSIVIELVLAIVVVGVTAALIITPPPTHHS